MGELAKRLDTAERAFQTLQESLNSPYNTIVRDSCLLRFSYTFDCCWKLLKNLLEDRYGTICNSPEICIREAFQNNLLDENEAELWLAMVDDRNQIVHSYVEAIAQSIYSQLPRYGEKMESLLRNIHTLLNED